jgi:hypothetical protein
MNVDKIDDIARLATAGCCHGFISRQIGRMQHVAEIAILHDRKKPEVAIDDPLKFGARSILRDQSWVECSLASLPSDLQTCLFKCCGILVGGTGYTLLAVMEDVDIVGKARS